MNRSIFLRILHLLAIVVVLALAAVGLEQTVAALSQRSGSGPTAQPRVVQPEALSAAVTAPPTAQIQPTATATAQIQPTATATAPPPAQIQPTAPPAAPRVVPIQPTANAAAPPSVHVKVEGRITAVNAAAGTITVQDDDGPPTVVALGAVRGAFYVWQKVEVFGIMTNAGSNGATVQAQFIQLKSPDGDDDGYAAAPGAPIKVEGRITAVNAAAGTITVQDDDGPPTVVALGAARGTFYVWQKVEVFGAVTSAGSNGATVQAQFIRLDS
jgi:hypothetical protein